jgi:hypothetical protein
MSAVAVETPVEPWELHSELVLVCPEVFKRALELLPDRDPDAFLSRPRPPKIVRPRAAESAEVTPALAGVAFRYAVWRLGQTARSALIPLGTLVALASLAEVLH